MERYNYREAIKADIKNYISEAIDFAEYGSLEELIKDLDDIFWKYYNRVDDDSESCIIDEWEAAEYVCHNLDLLRDAIRYFNVDFNIMIDDAKCADMLIRSYLSYDVICEVVHELESDFNSVRKELMEE